MNIKITQKGNGLEKLVKKAKELDGQHEVPISELFSPGFVSSCSSFKDVNELFEASGYQIESAEDFAAIPDSEWDKFISENTSYNSWEEMQQGALSVYVKNKLGL